MITCSTNSRIESCTFLLACLYLTLSKFIFFFFQAEDGIRDVAVTGVRTCALPILVYTILQPTFFTEVWLTPALGFDSSNAKAQIYGGGENKISWISIQDVAQFTVAALHNRHAKNAVVELGGPEPLSPLDVVRLAEQITRKRFDVQHVPEAALRVQYGSATDPLQQSFAALMLLYAHGTAIDMTRMLRAFPGQHLRSVREHFEAGTRAPTSVTPA